jgi:hypothetical protein
MAQRQRYNRTPVERLNERQELMDYAPLSSSAPMAIHAPKYNSTYVGLPLQEISDTLDAREKSHQMNKAYLEEVNRGVRNMNLDPKDSHLYKEAIDKIEGTMNNIVSSGSYAKAGNQVSDVASSIINDPRYKAAIQESAELKVADKTALDKYQSGAWTVEEYNSYKLDRKKISSVDERLNEDGTMVNPMELPNYADYVNLTNQIGNYMKMYGTDNTVTTKMKPVFNDLQSVNNGNMREIEFQQKYGFTSQQANNWGIAQSYDLSRISSKNFDGRYKENQGRIKQTYRGKELTNAEANDLKGGEAFALQSLLSDSKAMAYAESQAKAINNINNNNATSAIDVLLSAIRGKNTTMKEVTKESENKINTGFTGIIQKNNAANFASGQAMNKVSKLKYIKNGYKVSPVKDNHFNMMSENLANINKELELMEQDPNLDQKNDKTYLNLKSQRLALQSYRNDVLATLGGVDDTRLKNIIKRGIGTNNVSNFDANSGLESSILDIFSESIKNGATEEELVADVKAVLQEVQNNSQWAKDILKGVKTAINNSLDTPITPNIDILGDDFLNPNLESVARKYVNEMITNANSSLNESGELLNNTMQTYSVLETKSGNNLSLDNDQLENILKSATNGFHNLVGLSGVSYSDILNKKGEEGTKYKPVEHQILTDGTNVYLEVQGMIAKKDGKTYKATTELFTIPQNTLEGILDEFNLQADKRGNSQFIAQTNELVGKNKYGNDFLPAINNNRKNYILAPKGNPELKGYHGSNTTTVVKNGVYTNVYSFAGNQATNNRGENTSKLVYLTIPKYDSNDEILPGLLNSEEGKINHNLIKTKLELINSEIKDTLSKVSVVENPTQMKLAIEKIIDDHDFSFNYQGQTINIKRLINSYNVGDKNTINTNPNGKIDMFNVVDDYNEIMANIANDEYRFRTQRQ